MRIVLLTILLISFAACQGNKKIPKEVLPEAKMRSVLWDLMRADEWVSYEYTKDSSLNRFNRSMELYQKVFQVNNITASQFKKSFQYYQGRPDLLKPLFDSLQHKSPKFSVTAL